MRMDDKLLPMPYPRGYYGTYWRKAQSDKQESAAMGEETPDTSTCAERLRALADRPEHEVIRGELLHAAAELDGMREALRNSLDQEDLKVFERWVEAQRTEAGRHG